MKPFLLSLLSFIVVAMYGQSPMRKCDLQSSKTLIKNNHAFINPEISDTNHVTSLTTPLVEKQFSMVHISKEKFSYLPPSDQINKPATFFPFDHLKTSFTLDENISLLTARNYDNYIYEGSTSFGVSLIWQPTQKLTFDLTPNISSFFYGPHQLMSVVKPSVSASCLYRLMNWLSIKAFGEYTMDGSKLPAYSLLAPQNIFGAGVMVKVYKGIGIEAGIEEIYYNGQWHRNFYSNPTNY